MLVPIFVLGWFRFGKPPVAVADAPLPMEKAITSVPLHARIDREIQSPPIAVNEDNLTAGAHIYSDRCAVCHGFHGKPSAIAAHMFPKAPALWEKHKRGSTVGVSDDPPGETYWKVTNGIRLSGMPAFDHILTSTQMWQVSVLLANADKPLPPEVLSIVTGEQSPSAASTTST
ncbi:MAG: c-type cytochrome, partial [Terracidiphilus sp.]